MDEQLNEVAPSVETEVERMEVDQVAEEPAADESQVAEIAAEEPVPEAPQEEPASTAEDEVPGPTAETPPVDEIPAVDETPPVDDTPPVDEAPPVPEESAPEENVQGSPHAMEMADFPEENQNAEDVQDPEEDPNKTLPQDPEKSMNETVLNSSAIDPFDAVKTTSDLDSTPIEQTDNDAAPATPPTEEVDAAPTAEDDKVPEVAADDEPADDTSMREDSPQEEDKEDDRDDREEGPNEGDVEEIDDGEDEDVQILADCEREITEADEESARLEEEREAEEAASEAPVELDDDELETQDVEMETEPAPAETETDPDTVSIFFILDTVRQCEVCQQKKCCQYRVREGEKVSYLCEDGCVTAFIGENTQKYMLKRKKYEAEPDTSETETPCYQCEEEKICQFSIAQDDEKLWLCEDVCLNLLLSEQSDRVRMKQQSGYKAKAKPVEPSEAVSEKFTARSEEEVEHLKMERDQTFVRHCSQCCEVIQQSPKTIYWETMDFCHEQCLGMYQHMTMSTCVACGENVSMLAMGKYCVRFGFEVRQFCRAGCLEAYKKNLKCCTYCQENISPEVTAVVAHVGEKRVIKDFCSSLCRRKYEDIVTPPHRRKLPVAECDVCNQRKMCRVQLVLDGKEFFFCKNPCFSAFKFVNNVSPDECGACSKYFDRRLDCNFTIYKNPIDPVVFCSRICQNVFVTLNRIIAECNWCKVKKYNFDMAQRPSVHQFMCSINCLSLSELTQQAITQTCLRCDHCRSLKQAQYHLTMSDGSIRNFCMYQCVMAFQNRYSKQPLTLDRPDRNQPVPTGLPKRIKKSLIQQQQQSGVPLISSVHSLAGDESETITYNGTSTSLRDLRINLEPISQSGFRMPPPPPEPAVEKRTNLIVVPAPETQIQNRAIQTKPKQETKAISCRPAQMSVELQTSKKLERKQTIPIPVPLYVPTPAAMYAEEIPIPVPIPIPIPVPIFIPTSRNSAAGILKEIRKIHEKMPADPYEAELLMMADMVAGGKKEDDSESDSDDEDTGMYHNQGGFNEDLVQMALKMASNDYDDHVDLESAMQANTITHQQPPQTYEDVMLHQQQLLLMQEQQRQNSARGRKRGPTAKQSPSRVVGHPVANNKRVKREIEEPMMSEQPREPEIKPDANMCLKYTFGVNAWKQWVLTKNAEIEKSGTKRRPFKQEILQMTADELNYSLCLFVKEVRKPNGSEYAPDTIYYLVLGIQQYLYENGRIDNIFTDSYYDRFTDCLDEVARKFSVLYNDSQYIVTRVEEEHLWECKQLGAHSPHVLLSTLMFFNTKHFNLTSVEEHSELSFSHIMKHWKRGPGQTTGHKGHQALPGQRNVLLRYYPPQSALSANARKKKVYEQSENEENPLRCPVKLYEFYLSKCPESVKTRNDVFYLQPERSCVPDSPVWYSTQAMSKDGISKMLHRVKMVKEINIALLTS